MLPLAVKSIASLLRHEAEEERWKEILESELWESDASNEIFRPLQRSYACLPTYLKSCFLYCSMFPKYHLSYVGDLVKLWIYQGFIESKGNKTAEQIGFQYAEELCERSLFERIGRNEGYYFCKLHDIVHDLARQNSKNGCFSIDVNKRPILPDVLHHLYIVGSVKLVDSIPSDKFTALRTFITLCSVKQFCRTFDFSMAPKLRALEMRESRDCELEFLSSIGNLKHLRYLLLGSILSETLPENICSLYNLQSLTLWGSNLKELPNNIGNLVSLQELIIYHCFSLNFVILPESLCQLKTLKIFHITWCYRIKELPNNIGNLVSLEELKIHNCGGLRVLPGSLGQLKALRKLCLIDCELLKELPSDMGSLTNLRTLEMRNTGVSCLPPSLSKFVPILALKVELKCETIGWLKDFSDLEGALCLYGLKNIPNLMDVQCANLLSMNNLEHLILDWNHYHGVIDGSVLKLIINRGHDIYPEEQSCFSVLVCLQPHHNLTKLQIEGYNGITLPKWFGNLCKLKSLNITFCLSLQFLKAESLTLELEELVIFGCDQLVSMPGIQKLKSLVKLSVYYCEDLCSFMEPSLELTMRARGAGSLLGLRNLTSLRSLKISNCFKLQVLADEFLPADTCNVRISDCPGLREWCLQHGINYKENDEPETEIREDEDEEEIEDDDDDDDE